MQNKNIYAHEGSGPHTLAATIADPCQQTIGESRKVMQSNEKAAYISALRTIYWLAVEELPNAKYASLLNLQRVQGCDSVTLLNRAVTVVKESPWTFNQLVSSIDTVIMVCLNNKCALSCKNA